MKARRGLQKIPTSDSWRGAAAGLICVGSKEKSRSWIEMGERSFALSSSPSSFSSSDVMEIRHQKVFCGMGVWHQTRGRGGLRCLGL